MTSRQTPMRADQQPGERGQPDRVLTPEIVTLAVVVVLGSIMTILDATIVNVALPTLGREFGAPISVIQWVPTVYLLAFASVIPLTGWASERFGAKRVWLVALAAFMLGSLLCGLSGSVTELIVCRVPQGLGGGMIMPIGQAILAWAAGPARIGRVMSIVGVPLLLGPVAGPVIGGAIVGATTAVTPYAYLAAALLAIGAGLGATITPSMAAAFQSAGRESIASATSAIGTIQRVAGSLARRCSRSRCSGP